MSYWRNHWKCSKCGYHHRWDHSACNWCNGRATTKQGQPQKGPKKPKQPPSNEQLEQVVEIQKQLERSYAAVCKAAEAKRVEEAKAETKPGKPMDGNGNVDGDGDEVMHGDGDVHARGEETSSGAGSQEDLDKLEEHLLACTTNFGSEHFVTQLVAKQVEEARAKHRKAGEEASKPASLLKASRKVQQLEAKLDKQQTNVKQLEEAAGLAMAKVFEAKARMDELGEKVTEARQELSACMASKLVGSHDIAGAVDAHGDDEDKKLLEEVAALQAKLVGRLQAKMPPPKEQDQEDEDSDDDETEKDEPKPKAETPLVQGEKAAKGRVVQPPSAEQLAAMEAAGSKKRGNDDVADAPLAQKPKVDG